MSDPILTDWWGYAASLEARIKLLLPAGWTVCQSKGLVDVLESQQRNNVVHIVPIGLADVKSEASGKQAIVTHRVALVFAVWRANDKTGEQQRTGASAAIGAVLPQIMGWSPGNGWTSMELAAPPGKDIVTASYAYYPFGLELSAVIQSTVKRGD